MGFKKITLVILIFFHVNSLAESVSIPLTEFKKPSSDLVDSKGENIDAGQLVSMANQGQDISLLNPKDNEIWQNKTYSFNDLESSLYPSPEVGVKWLYSEAEYSQSYMSMYMGRVLSGSDGRAYRMTLSRSTNSALLRSALLRRLGYFIPSPKFYQNLRVYFKDEESKKDFLKLSQTGMGTDFESRKWVIEDNSSNHSLVFSAAILEPASSDYFDIAWGMAPAAKNPNQVGKLQILSKYRAFRALIIPYILSDIPESINRYSPKIGSVLANQVVLNHPFADSFTAITKEDAKWIVRKILSLSEEDITQIVRESKLPAQLVELAKAKLIYRIHNLAELFNMNELFRLKLPKLEITTSDGIVTDGKVMTESISGYPFRYAHGDRQSPYSEGDLGRYLKIDGMSSVIGSVLSKFNQNLQFQDVSDLAAKRRETVLNNVIDHYKKTPFVPYSQKVESWGGPIGGFNFNSSRHVATGTYFNSTASLQLVDNLSVGGSLGYFMSIDGVKSGTPFLGSNITINRDYTHVHPINSITEGAKEPWKELNIPSVMNKLAKVLENTNQKNEKGPIAAIDSFLSELREGEVFLVTDSVQLGAYAQYSTPLDNLMGISPLSFMNSISFGVDAGRVTLGQTLFTRTKDGIQIYVRKQNSKVLGAQFDINYFINLFSYRAQTNHLKATSDAFVIDYDPEYVAKLDLKDEKNKKYLKTQEDLRLALVPLFLRNDSEILYGRFKNKMFVLDHDVKTKQTSVKLALFRMKGFTEGQLVQVTPPANENKPNLNPEADKISLYSDKKGQLVGTDLLGLGLSFINGILSNKNSDFSWNSSTDPNPANTPYGKAYWRIVDSERDVSVNPGKYQYSAYIQHVWGGWSLNKKKFFDLVDEIQSEFDHSSGLPYRIIEKESFANIKSIDFYRITVQASVLENGITKLRDLLLQSDVQVNVEEKKKGFFSKILQKLKGGPKRNTDKELYDDIMLMLGSGNYQLGVAHYKQQCKEYYEKQFGQSEVTIPVSWYKGTSYECLVPWMSKLINLSRSFPSDKKDQTKWVSEVLWELDQNIPLPTILNYLGKENYLFFTRVNGFRQNDEDGDLEFFSNTMGEPPNSFEYSNGLINYWSQKTRILPVEMDRTQGGFQ